MNKRNNWSELLLLANEDLRAMNTELEVVKNNEDYYSVFIKSIGTSSCFAENFFEDELSDVINDAWANARVRGNSKTVYVVTYVTISSSDPAANGYTDAKSYNDKDKAAEQLRRWRDDELELRKESGCYYHVYDDKPSRFHCTWDADNEGVIVSLHETILS